MKNILYVLVFLASLTSFSQQKSIDITNVKPGKTKYFEETQRIKIRTLDGKKHVGNLKFSDSLSFTVNNQPIKIDSLQSIKKQPKTMATIKTVVFITGLAIVGSSLVAASDGNDAAFLLFTIGSGVTIGAGLLEGINANNSNNRWRFKIIEKQ